MLRLSLLFLLVIVCPLRADDYFTSAPELPKDQQDFADDHARAIRIEFRDEGLSAVAKRTDQALDRIVEVSLERIKTVNSFEADYAEWKRGEWAVKYHGYLSRSLAARGMRDIGDHKPLIQWLADFYNHIESVLGVDVCKSLHLSDIKTLNFAIPIVFHPCTFPMDAVTGERIDEYRRHFAKGDVYWGLMPVVVYWVVDIICDVSTQGTGIIWFCGPIGGAAEFITGKWIAPKISDNIYNRACN